jgi:hypothetical protein
MAMRTRLFLQRVGKEFVRNLFWCLVGFAPVGAVLVAWTDSSLSEVLALGGIFATVLAVLITVPVVWSGGDSEARVGGHDYPGSPPEARGGDWPGGGWDSGGVGEGGGW